MSTETETTSTSREELRSTVWGILAQLRQRIRTYVLALTFSRLLICLGAMFWGTLFLDQLYFMTTNLELSVGFRKFLIGCGFIGIPLLVVWSLWPLFRQMQFRSLALVLERRFPQLNDRLITTVEYLQNDNPTETNLTRQMFSQTVREVGQQLYHLPVGQVFERKPLQRVVITAIAVVMSVVVFVGMNQEAAARWKSAYVEFASDYWERKTELRVKVLSQPGDIVREFNGEGAYKHPRGRDLVLVVEVPEGSNVEGKPWRVPDRVRIDMLSQGREGRVVLNRTGDREFRYTFTKLLHDLEFDLRGGDFRNREPYKIRMVEPPQIDEIVLDCLYPAYTKLAPVGRDGQPQREQLKVQGGQISVPHETEFLLNCRTNKPLVRATIRTDKFELTIRPDEVKWLPLTAEGEANPAVVSDISEQSGILEEGYLLSFPFQLTKQIEDESAQQVPAVIGPSELVRIVLEDADGVISDQPIRLNITGVEDLPPQVETELTGISSSITRKAVIPMMGLITDDYGITKARFEYRIEEEAEWQARRFKQGPKEEPVEFQLARSTDEIYESFEVLPLDLSEGQRLTITVYAEDGDVINGPHETRSQQYVFSIVDADELLSLLYNKELNLRRRFERIIEEMEKTQRDFDTAMQQVVERKKLVADTDAAAAEKIVLLQRSIAVAAQRGLFQVRKNRSETRAVEEAFRNLLLESVNNGVHTGQMVSRIQGLIADPLKDIHEKEIPALDEQLGLFKLSLANGDIGQTELTDSIRTTAQILVQMKTILEEMRDLLEFHEALQNLKEIIDLQKDLSEETERQQKDKLIDSLKSLGIE